MNIFLLTCLPAGRAQLVISLAEKIYRQDIFLLSSAGPDEAMLVRMLTEASALEHLSRKNDI